MSARRTDFAISFRRAAIKRRAAARVLYSNAPPLYTDAVYLAGYAGECMLKALLLKSTPTTQQADLMLTEFKGKVGHDIEHLTDRLARAGVSWPPLIHSGLLRIKWWSTNLRYETRELDASEADEFLNALDLVLNWAEGRLS